MSFLLAMHSSASMLKQMFVQPTPPLHTAVARAKSQYVTPFIAMYYVVLTPSSAAQAARALYYYHIVLISSVESLQDFLIKLDMKPRIHLVEITIFSLKNVTVRPLKIMNRADKNWAHF